MGTSVNVGGKQFSLVPLKLKAWVELTAAGHIANLGSVDDKGLPTAAGWRAVIAVVAAGIGQVCPELGTAEWVEQNLEPGEAELVLPVILRRRSTGSPGEAVGP